MPSSQFVSHNGISRLPLVQIGTGWDQNLWSPAQALTRLDLDACIPDGRPCLLYRRCWHAAAVNSAALRAADIDPDKPWSPVAKDDNDTDTGDITTAPPPSVGAKGEPEAAEAGAGGGMENVRETGDGVVVDGDRRPTGLFREGSMRLIEGAITAPSFEMRCVRDPRGVAAVGDAAWVRQNALCASFARKSAPSVSCLSPFDRALAELVSELGVFCFWPGR